MKLKSKVIGSDCKISVNGISICYDDFGTGNIPIIFIHGFPFDKSTWRKQMDYFNANYRVISYDIRGLVNLPAIRKFIVLTYMLTI